ncbi:MAG: ATPase, T2SS/T4P/T4SS family, partial [Candidatus Omnitrophica bacterium]|nr:ATPase, T2SS/T4P/T4SS family [Candidatus Omnitrophota bacterium]
MADKRALLEDKLVTLGLLAQEQLTKAKQEASRTGLSLERVIIKLGMLSEEDIAAVVAQGMGVPFMDIKNYLIDPAVIKFVPEALAKKYSVIPLFKIQDTLTVAMANPQDIFAIDEVRAKSKCAVVETVLATKSAIEAAIDQYYDVKGNFEDVIKQIDKAKYDKAGEGLDEKVVNEMVQDAPIIKLVNIIITQALKDGASDIHVEPEEDALRVRYRVDGILHETSSPPKNLSSAIISRIKVMAHMDISEKRKPQDGRIQLKLENKNIDLRVSSFPTIYGENIVIRILDKTSVLLGMGDLGFEAEDLKAFEKIIKRPYGIVLVTGPTGSGKTTTLYAALSTINSADKNIITIEDPVEYQIPMIRQTQVNPKAGLTFATGLRSILRQDPDIIMVGEIRDKETAEIAIQAALTGHLVLSTLHTNDAVGALTRLVDMGIEPFLVAGSIAGVIAQRLVRTICKNCKEEYPVSAAMFKSLGAPETDKTRLYRGKGCKDCKSSGYKGRAAIFE